MLTNPRQKVNCFMQFRQKVNYLVLITALIWGGWYYNVVIIPGGDVKIVPFSGEYLTLSFTLFTL